ncbi:uncharacterized protein isoform X2 [Choristoneura fumiferana]|uniref:uncharacterized protein isoform X2 n=1 Tax=Choristoneura fumiferana TaxID=7141 RepID=UPI003D15C737
MTRSSDIMFMAEYIKNVLYFATVRQDKELKSTEETHYFCIDNELLYENYYSDFGPLNLGCVYKYCKLLSEKFKVHLNKQTIVHYTSIDPKKKANAAFLLGCYGVLYLSLSPKDALKPLTVRGASYRAFQDATLGDSEYTISILDCLKAIKKASELGFFDFKDFNFDEYDRLDKIAGGDLNWIVPGKFLAFIGPVDYNVSLYHPPEIYIDYFLENNVKIVVRLNKRLYDQNVFNNAGIIHYDLFFADGSCPPRHILYKFLQISEDADGALAVHCKAGLGRTGSLIGSYLIKHYRMSAREAIGWMRICRPGSVIGHQQAWLEHLEPWLLKQGNLYRKKHFHDTEKLPTHEYGVYSIAEKSKQRPVIFQKTVSPPPPMQRSIRSDVMSMPRPQASRVREAPSPSKVDKDQGWQAGTPKNGSKQKITNKGDHSERPTSSSKRGGAGESRTLRSPSRLSARPQAKNSARPNASAFGTNRSELKNFLMKSSTYKDDRANPLHSSITVTPHYASRLHNYSMEQKPSVNAAQMTPSSFSAVSQGTTQPQRRRLGRSPSPSPPPPRIIEKTRATNTPTPSEKILARNASKIALKEALSRLKVIAARDGSIGAASVGAGSLGARRDAPIPMRAPSVRSDERPLATQGDMLNSIKFQRRFRETLNAEKLNQPFHEKFSILNDKEGKKREGSINNITSITNTSNKKTGIYQNYNAPREKSPSRGSIGPTRPLSPKGRRIVPNVLH